MGTYLNNGIAWTAWKLSGKDKEHFGFLFEWYWFLSRSTWKAAWNALRDKTPTSELSGLARLYARGPLE
jgi:hypothetical protein